MHCTELDAVDSDGEEGADFGGQRKAGRLDERLGDDRHDDESDEGMGSMEQDGAQQGEGSHMVDVSWEEEEGRQMMLMLTARQDVGEEAAAAGVDEEDQEAAGPTKEEMEAMLRDAVQVVRQAREQRGRAAGGGVSPSLDEQSEASQGALCMVRTP